MLVLSLCDRTGVMVQPWADAGYQCVCVDMQHKGERTEGNITFVGADITDYLPPRSEYRIAFGFPPCTHLANCGNKHKASKGFDALIEALPIVRATRRILEWTDAPWMLENPVGSLSTYWRKPDHTFHPCDYTGFELGDNYSKRTCLWTGGGFVMPPPESRPGFRPARRPDTQGATVARAWRHSQRHAQGLRAGGVPRQRDTNVITGHRWRT